MKTPLIVINGESGSGKTTAVDYLVQNWHYEKKPFTPIHPIAYLKRFLEDVYKCPNLDTKKGKNFKAENSPSTMQEIMVRLWEVFVKEDLDPALSQRLMSRNLAVVPRETPLVFCAIRNLGEVDFLAKLAAERNMQIHFLRLETPDEIQTAETSDALESQVANQLFQLSGPGNSINLVNRLDSIQAFQVLLHAQFMYWGLRTSDHASFMENIQSVKY